MVLSLRRRPQAAAVARDAQSLIQLYGPEAYRVAADMSWREDAGLLMAPEDGHWHRVHSEIGRRIGQSPPSWENDMSPDPRHKAKPLPMLPAEHQDGKRPDPGSRGPLRFASTAD